MLSYLPITLREDGLKPTLLLSLGETIWLLLQWNYIDPSTFRLRLYYLILASIQAMVFDLVS